MAEPDWDEVKQRIAECKKDGGVNLSLVGLGFADVEDPVDFEKVLGLAARRFPALEALAVDICGEAKTLEVLAGHLERLPELQSLEVVVTGDRALEVLAVQAHQLPTVRCIGLEQIGDNGLKALAAHAHQFSGLEEIHCDSNQFGDDGLLALAAQTKHLVNLHTVAEYDVQNLQFGPKGCAALLRNLIGIKTLRLEAWRHMNAGLKGLAKQGKDLWSLETFDLSQTDVGDEGLKSLAAQARHLVNLRELCLAFTEVTDEGVKTLAARAKHLAKLEQLSFRYAKVGNPGVLALARAAEAGHLRNLRSLDLARTDVGDAGVQAFSAAASQLDNLEFLMLGTSEIGDKGLSALAAHAKHFRHLRLLDLEHTGVTDEGVRTLAAHLRDFKNLEALVLLGTQVTDEGVRILAEHAKSLAKLEYLDLSETQTGDDGLKALAFARKSRRLRCLKRLNVIDTGVRSVSAEVLQTENAEQIFEAVLDGLTMPEAKLVVLGEPGVGKTSLCQRAFRGRITHRRTETHDFELIVPHWRPRIGNLKVTLRVWDFGGQHVLHGTHEMFLTSRSVCLLVLDVTQVEEHDPEETNPERDGNRLSYWLRMIRHFVGPDAPVILVITQCDRPQEEHRLDRLDGVRGFTSQIQVVESFSATEKSPVWKDAVTKLRDAIAHALDQMEALRSRVSREFVTLKERVEKEVEGRAIISLKEYRRWCKEAGVRSRRNQDDYLQTLHHFGSVFYFGVTEKEREDRQRSRATESLPPGQLRLLNAERDSVLEDWLINPRWLKWPVYELVRESDRRPWLTDDDIRAAVNKHRGDFTVTQPALAEKVVREVLKLTELCFYDQERGAYFFPRGLPLDGDRFLTGWNRADCHEVIWQWDFFPEAVIHRFIVQAHQRREIAKDARWRTGAVLKHGDSTAAIQSVPENGKVTVWLKKRSHDEVQFSREDEKFIDRIRHRLCDLIGCEPKDECPSRIASVRGHSGGDRSEPTGQEDRGSTLPAENSRRGAKVPKYAEEAYLAFERAATSMERQPTDQEAYDWLKERDADDYELPEFDTWAKYLRIVRKHCGTSKNTPRAGREGRSTPRQDQL